MTAYAKHVRYVLQEIGTCSWGIWRRTV